MSRTAARDLALKLVFARNFGSEEWPEPDNDLYFSKHPEQEEPALMTLSPEDEAYVRGVVEGLEAQRNEIEDILTTHSIGWKPERMPKVDLAILQLSTYELLFTDISVSVAINEAVELAKKYSTADSAAFINGLLGKIVKEHT